MTIDNQIPNLQDLSFIAYLTEDGNLDETWQGKIGVYAIFDQEKNLQWIAYSRDIYASLKQNLVRKPQSCYWLKVQTIEKPNRTILENIRQQWINENGSLLSANGEAEKAWTDPIDTKLTMTEDEKNTYLQTDELGQVKLLKTIARRVETEILEQLKQRGVNVEIRFNPKLKEKGLLDLK
jgi:hypothetical protein